MSKIYSIGYQGITPQRLQAIAEGLDAVVFDVRSSPRSRKKGFGGNQLRELLGARYEQHKELGGWEEIAEQALVDLALEERNVILMCQEEAPGECHRFHKIAVPLLQATGLDVVHIYQDELIDTSDLLAAIEADEESGGDDATYDCDSLSELLSSLKSSPNASAIASQL